MLITLHANGNVNDKEQIFLNGSYSLLKTFLQICEFLKSDLEADYATSESRDMGISIEQDALMQMEEMLQDLESDKVGDILVRGYFGSGLCTQKFTNAYRTLTNYSKAIIKSADEIFKPTANSSYTLKELKSMGKHISFAVGDLIYALSNIIFNPVDARWVLENPEEEISYSSELQTFFYNIRMTPEEFAKHLVGLQHDYISVIPLYEGNPDAWEQITSQLHPSLVDTLTDYGVYITTLDVRAIKAGLLSIDENYLDTLNARSENPDYIANAAPEEWATFMKLIPDKYIATFIDIDDALTPGLLEPALQDNEIDDGYVTWLLNFLKGEANEATNYFNKDR